MDYQNLLLDCRDRVALVTLNRPQALNALNGELIEELAAAIAVLEADPEVAVIILTGAGEKAFVAGADIVAMAALDPAGARNMAHRGHQLMSAIEKGSKPVIAAINGFALGGGCELAMACDLRIASETARFGQPEVNLGVIPGYGGTQRLPRLVGKGRALELLLTGDMIDAREAHRIGLVNQVVPAAELLDAARKLALKIAAKGQLAVRTVKELVACGLEMDLDRAARYEADLFGICFTSSDQQEGMQAFMEKRPAKFTGR